MPRKEFAKLVLRVKRGEHFESDGVQYLQVPWFRMTTAEPMTVNVDGESTELRQARYEACPQNLLIHFRACLVIVVQWSVTSDSKRSARRRADGGRFVRARSGVGYLPLQSAFTIWSPYGDSCCNALMSCPA